MKFIFKYFLLMIYYVHVKSLNLETQIRLTQNFTRNCNTISLSGTNLSAYCTRNDGSSGFTYFNINKCISNVNGSLMRGSNFSSNSFDCNLTKNSGNGINLECMCTKTNGAIVPCKLDLNTIISNKNGTLAC
jgi:hypothetical protein